MMLSDLHSGDSIKGFNGFGCIPDDANRVVYSCDDGLYVKCRAGQHLLDGQVGDDGHLVGLSRRT